MSKQDPPNYWLPKWPAIVVEGDNVTTEQAEDIIIRTCSWYLSCNARWYQRAAWEALGLTVNEFGYPDYEDEAKFKESIGVLDLEYLSNDQIVSSYIGGPHGWCDWDGSIGYSGHNIGKHPTTEDVFNEWTLIAEAFPYLRLRCQLFSGESTEDDIRPVIEYQVRDGRVTWSEPAERMGVRHRDFIEAFRLVAALTDSSREIRLMPDKLVQVVERVKARFQTQTIHHDADEQADSDDGRGDTDISRRFQMLDV